MGDVLSSARYSPRPPCRYHARPELDREARAPGADEIVAVPRSHFTFACAFRRSAQYRFIRADTALRAAADIVRVRVAAFCRERRTARRRCGSCNSGNVRSIAMISARRRWSVTSAPVRARSRRWEALKCCVLGIRHATDTRPGQTDLKSERSLNVTTSGPNQVRK